MHATVAPGVAVVDTQIAAGKAGVIAGERVALAVDAGIDDTEGAAVLAAAQAFGSDEVALVYTHGHIDHALGGTAFAGRRIYAHAEVGWYMRTQLEAWAARTGETTASLDARLGWPTATITGAATLDLGGRRVCFVAAPGHAPGAICIFDPEARVLFGGDTVVTAIPPAFSDGDSGVLEDTLRRLAAATGAFRVRARAGCVRRDRALRHARPYHRSQRAPDPGRHRGRLRVGPDATAGRPARSLPRDLVTPAGSR